MQKVKSLGNVSWSREEIKNAIPEFLELYQKRPIQDNEGGMRIPHMFATWLMLRQLQPQVVIESGVWRGQGTWLIEQTLPQTKIYGIDPNLKRREYTVADAKYFTQDFSEIDWKDLPKEETLLFFDDHQNAFARIKSAEKWGFKHLIFEDNYPPRVGDCYSLKKAFCEAGFQPETPTNWKFRLKSLLQPSLRAQPIPPNTKDMEYLKKVLDIYYEFPPVFQAEKTRWGTPWDCEHYYTPEPLFENLENEDLKIFREEAPFYTWICYARLK